MTDAMGRRERKKAQTRRTIADTAMRLFLERGFDAVSVREIAQEADVATATLFAHFRSKEAMVFDEDAEQELLLADAVRNRSADTTAPDALRAWYHAVVAESRKVAGLDRYHRLIDGTPSLRDYEARMWARHESTLAAVLAEEAGVPAETGAVRVMARAVIDVMPLVRSHPHPDALIDEAFDFLDAGWRSVAVAARAARKSPATSRRRG